MKLLRRFFLCLLILSASSGFSEVASEPNAVTFTPPKGWRLAEQKELAPSVKTMVIGKGKREFPPSINLAVEPYSGTLKQYLKIVKSINNANRADWKDLGSIRTLAGDANLSQVDEKAEWGDIRMMHVIFVKNGYAYILTAASLKEEFSAFYKDFFASMRSLNISNDAFEMVTDTQENAKLKDYVENVKNEWYSFLASKQTKSKELPIDSQDKRTLFESSEFQTSIWSPFKAKLAQDFANMTPEWQTFLLSKLQTEMVN